MNERLVDVDFDDLRGGDEFLRTEVIRARMYQDKNGWSADGFPRSVVSWQRVERDPEPPTTPGAVIWAEDSRRPEQPAAAYQLTGSIWLRVGSGTGCYADEITRVHAVLRDPGADT